MNTFKEFNLLPTLQATLEEKNLRMPTEIQQRAVPLLLKGQSIVGVAETGSGKTLAFALPVLHALKTLENEGNPIRDASRPRAVVVVPTRELGEQVSKVFKPFTHTTRLRVRTLLGGTTMEVAKRSIQGPYEILIATPGRLVKLLDRRLLSFEDVRTLVFDEADQMLDQGFLPDASAIVRACPAQRQLVLFSATVSPSVQKLINKLMPDDEIIRSRGSHKVVPTLTTENREIVDGKRFPVLEAILESTAGTSTVGGQAGGQSTGQLAGQSTGTMIFTNTREQCDKLFSELTSKGLKCVIYRGQMEKVERRSNLKSFRDGEVDLLISTDLASRGLDLEHVARVINYHLPQGMDNYLHRVGRTARAGRKGLVINFVTERDEPLIKQLDGIKATTRKSHSL